jgi:hypothetical protein
VHSYLEEPKKKKDLHDVMKRRRKRHQDKMLTSSAEAWGRKVRRFRRDGDGFVLFTSLAFLFWDLTSVDVVMQVK